VLGLGVVLGLVCGASMGTTCTQARYRSLKPFSNGRYVLLKPSLYVRPQVVCVIVLGLGVALGLVSALSGAAVGKACAWCPQVACAHTPWWDCSSGYAAAAGPGCDYTALTNGSALLDCSMVRSTEPSSLARKRGTLW
jgi:hypothetical protein